MKKISDFIYIFELFPRDYRPIAFINLINYKMKELLQTALDEKDKNLLFKIFDEWLISNDFEYNDSDLKSIVNYFVEENNLSELTSDYFSYLLKKQELSDITSKLDEIIISFFFKNKNFEMIISLVKDYDIFRDKILNELSMDALKLNDFYGAEENDNFIIFKIFIKALRNNESFAQLPEIVGSIYLNEITLTQNQIINELQKKDIQYKILDNI